MLDESIQWFAKTIRDSLSTNESSIFRHAFRSRRTGILAPAVSESLKSQH